ncbi:hypothetical protein MASR1M31_22590 [Porphyromonadaceae bacterium]
MEYKRKARQRLISEEGLEHRSKRPIEPEAVFGQMKYNMAYRRFRHFGLDKVSMDFAFFAIAFNIKKMCAKIAKGLSNGFINTKNGLKTAYYEVINDLNRIETKTNPKWAA